MKPLFIPLKREYFDAFESGAKTEEYRPNGPRWNLATCPVGRAVVLSCGYGKRRRLRGVIESFRVEPNPDTIPGWVACYGAGNAFAAAIIGIRIRKGAARE